MGVLAKASGLLAVAAWLAQFCAVNVTNHKLLAVRHGWIGAARMEESRVEFLGKCMVIFCRSRGFAGLPEAFGRVNDLAEPLRAIP
jgi:hypothetical protein